MITINIKNISLFVILFSVVGLLCVWYRHWEIENFYSQSIKECLEISPEDNEINTDIKMCDKACTLAPINTQIATIDTRLNLLEKSSDKHDTIIKSNTDIITKTSSDLKSLQDEIDKTKKELEEATEDQTPL